MYSQITCSTSDGAFLLLSRDIAPVSPPLKKTTPKANSRKGHSATVCM